jgi:hypothetical protein
MSNKSFSINFRTILISVFLTTVIGFSFSSCNTGKLRKTSIEDFEGNWQLEGRDLLDGIVVSIHKTDDGTYSGKVIALNENKFVQMFVQVGDTWITGIKRTSNFAFKIREKKIGSALFSLYGLDTTQEFETQFINETTIGLGAGNSDPLQSSIIYRRVE